MEIHLPSVPVLEIFSYLDAFSLLQAAQVNKNWNELADSDFLWRKLCLKRWFYPDMLLKWRGKQRWKLFFLQKIRQEHSLSQAKPEDIIYREMPGDFGTLGNASYLSESGLTVDGQGKSVVCLVTSMTKLTTWDIRKGIMTWLSPVQPTYILKLATLPEMQLVITTDLDSTIKVWNCLDKDALATSHMSDSCQSLKAVITRDGPVVLAGGTSGDLFTYRIPDLLLISRVHAMDVPINQLYCSPHNKWVFLNKKQPRVLPKVFFMDCLLRPAEYPTPVFCVISFTLCIRGFWTPRREDRITLMYQRGAYRTSGFATFDIELEKTENKINVEARAIASFKLPHQIESPEWMGVSDKNVIVCSSGASLLVYSMTGLQLQMFRDYPEEIIRLLVNPVYVIVTFIDGCLEVYKWEEKSHYLMRCYRLQNLRHMGPQSMITKTLCDNMSIARVVTKGAHCCFLMAYVLKHCS
ncbi:F-box/WD repeat-containing protein 12 [Phodopus roborovskii]|uniref:Fbxw21 protein n=1 Tax=Phodopus roborovskii TaxID=109678 RepID=A0AAU9YSJ5_PHORO|nr:F-box/WD repeat-containing protein 12 [Phodopus roborovskii]CAH6777658.1 Fbxw21 [Phodopus roborovskii]